MLHGPLGAQVARRRAPHGRAGGDACPPRARLAYENAYVNALQPVFLVAAGVAAVGFVLSLRLRERPLRATAATSTGLDDALAAPKTPELAGGDRPRAERAAAGEERRREFGERVAARAAWSSARRDLGARRFSSYGDRGHAGDGA